MQVVRSPTQVPYFGSPLLAIQGVPKRWRFIPMNEVHSPDVCQMYMTRIDGVCASGVHLRR
jgi:hypothetical protein